jgi:uncharacterized protein (DUF58 family)
MLAARHHVHALMVHDPREEAFPDVGLVVVRDPETGREAVLDSRSLAARVSVAERLASLRRCGARASVVSTEDDAFAVLQRHFRGVSA